MTSIGRTNLRFHSRIPFSILREPQLSELALSESIPTDVRLGQELSTASNTWYILIVYLEISREC